MYKANSLREAIANIYGNNVQITDRRSVHGGDINDAYALFLSNGETVFMKANTRQKLPIFEGEAESLAKPAHFALRKQWLSARMAAFRFSSLNISIQGLTTHQHQRNWESVSPTCISKKLTLL